jgi:hypothetical protein
MKVKDLLNFFNEEDLEKEVFMSSDAEGNSYHDIDEICASEDGSLIIFPAHEGIEIGESEELTEEENDAPHPDDNSASEEQA